MAPKTKPFDPAHVQVEASATDYATNMFQDGRDRTAHNKKAHDAPDYDRAAHTQDATVEENLKVDGETAATGSLQSRDGTEASGAYDEDGGSIGGTEEEIEAIDSNLPVDRTPYMKD